MEGSDLLMNDAKKDGVKCFAPFRHLDPVLDEYRITKKDAGTRTNPFKMKSMIEKDQTTMLFIASADDLQIPIWEVAGHKPLKFVAMDEPTIQKKVAPFKSAIMEFLQTHTQTSQLTKVKAGDILEKQDSYTATPLSLEHKVPTQLKQAEMLA